jgi:ketosteroid isomerase-like protein
MSQENVEIVRRVYEAVARRDAAVVFALYDPEVELDGSRLPESALTGLPHPLRGHEGLRKIARSWNEAWEYAEDHCDDLIDAGGEHVISVVTRRGRGLASGVEVETRRGGVWTIRDGKVVRTVWFPSVEEALEAVGLSEQDAHAAES